MRFLMLVRASKDLEAGKLPDAEVVAAVMKYREELGQAGVLVDVAALHPPQRARASASPAARTS